MYSLVVFTLVLITVLSSLIGSTVDSEVANASGGFGMRAKFNPAAQLGDPAAAFTSGLFAGKVAAVAPLRVAPATVTDLGSFTEPQDVTVVGADRALVDTGVFKLSKRLARFADDQAVWQATLTDARYVILDQYLGEDGGPAAITYAPGDTLTLTDPRTGKAEQKTIAGIIQSVVSFNGVGEDPFAGPIILGDAATRAQFGPGAKVSAALLKPAAGVSEQALAAELQGQFLPQSLVATRVRASVEQNFAANRGFFRLMQGFLALGLLVGIAGLGVVMVRAVRERRRNIGVLRALGFQAGTVQRAFLTESSFVALEGILVGAVLGVVTTYLLFQNDPSFDNASTGFPIPWVSIAVLVAATALASLAATAWPARKASRIRPAVALRIAD
jgi:putative ABC transport system permease protein